jgi:hypothetical protein
MKHKEYQKKLNWKVYPFAYLDFVSGGIVRGFMKIKLKISQFDMFPTNFGNTNRRFTYISVSESFFFGTEAMFYLFMVSLIMLWIPLLI